MAVVTDSPETESAPLRRRVDSRPVRGRYAPSPTGDLHLGNASTALLAWLSARAQDGRFVMRMEDLDQPRVRPGMADRILEDLVWLELDWDEGPDLGGPYYPYEQSRRSDLYDGAFRGLVEKDRVYPCFCSRKDIAAAASAPQKPGDEILYPGICRDLDPGEAATRIEQGTRHAWRFRATEWDRPEFADRMRGPWGTRAGQSIGDFVVRRSDGVASYQLAVVVDDAAMQLTEVVRGDDLLASTLRQLAIYEALELEAPGFAHVPLLLGPDGVRLSKRHAGVTIRELRDAGVSSASVVGRLAFLLGLRPDPDPVRPGELVAEFSFEGVIDAPEGIPVDPAEWLPDPS